MELARPRFLPDADRSRGEMEALQRELAAEAVFTDDLEGDPGRLGTHSGPPVAGVDQTFREREGGAEEAVSAAVLVRGGRVIERASAVRETAVPYIPGLLSFREGEAVLAALQALAGEPAVTLVDGSGRIHFREAGLATHVGVTLDTPTVGVAKNLLCGQPRRSVDGLEEGERVAIEADDDVSAPDGTVIGYAVQTRQFDSPNRHVNPVYVSPGHRVSAATAAEVVLACTAGYKLPEPTRLADAAADDLR
ncbi:endonuclease V [Salinirussus salinus]|uniref:endonuclease V n=1 Tax=Salinirussus salinus TaxID=1198300 RepID=UPI001356D4D2|nr:endonuclease V [Salinirussus salinus]